MGFWVTFWFFLHVAGAIVAFGPTFVFPLVEPVGKQFPAGFRALLALTLTMATKLVVPVAGTMLISGLGLIISAQVNPFKNPWLLVGIILYLTIMGLSTGHQIPNLRKVIALTDSAPPGPPSAEVQHLLERNKIVGMSMTAMLAIIVFMMVVKPGGFTPGW